MLNFISNEPIKETNTTKQPTIATNQPGKQLTSHTDRQTSKQGNKQQERNDLLTTS
jgi:hypothetical protein